MVPSTTRRRYLQAALAGLPVGVAGCSTITGPSTPRNEGSAAAYDLLLRHGYDYVPPEDAAVGDRHDVRVAIEVVQNTDEDEVRGEVVFERTLELPPEPTTRRFTDAFPDDDDAHEWVVSAEMEALVGDDPIVVGERGDYTKIDVPGTPASGTYRFQPGSDRAPRNDVVVVETDADPPERDADQLCANCPEPSVEVVRVGTVRSLASRTTTG